MPSMEMAKLAFTVGHTFTRFNLSAFPLCVLAASAAIVVWYLSAEWRLAARGRDWSHWRTASFLGGVFTVDVAFCSSVAIYAGTYFQAHIIQHLLLMVVAPALLALGAPSTLLLQTSRRSVKERWLHILRSEWFAALSHPVTTFALYFGVMFAFFLTSAIAYAMEHMAVMDVANLIFLLGGTLYWWPMIGIDPIIHWKMTHGMRLLSVLIGSGVEAFLGVAILADSKTAAPMYTLASTHAGGALLWVSTEFASLAAFVPIYIQWMRSDDREAAREDARGRKRLARPGRPVSAATATSAWEAAFAAKAGALPATRFERGEAASG